MSVSVNLNTSKDPVYFISFFNWAVCYGISYIWCFCVLVCKLNVSENHIMPGASWVWFTYYDVSTCNRNDYFLACNNLELKFYIKSTYYTSRKRFMTRTKAGQRAKLLSFYIFEQRKGGIFIHTNQNKTRLSDRKSGEVCVRFKATLVARAFVHINGQSKNSFSTQVAPCHPLPGKWIPHPIFVH